MGNEALQLSVIGARSWDPLTDNVDVEVELATGERFRATFFTLANLHLLFEKNRLSGECGAGLYFWATNMILVNELSIDVMRRAVLDLLSTGEFYSAFAKLEPPKSV